MMFAIDFDLAEQLAQAERDAGVRRAQAAVRGMSGKFVCDCGEPIGEARLAALPNARDCIDCATFAERDNRRKNL